MGNQDARSLPAEAQEDLRRRVVDAVQKGLSQTEVARVFGVARGTVSRWMGMVEREGRRALKAQRRGGPPVSGMEPRSTGTAGAPFFCGLPGPMCWPLSLGCRKSGDRALYEQVAYAAFVSARRAPL